MSKELILKSRNKYDYEPNSKVFYDIIIIGGGIVGFSTAMYARRLGLKTLIIGDYFGGTIMLTDVVENWPGIISASGVKLAKLVENHAKDYDNMWWNDENALEEFEGFKKFVKTKPGDVVLDIATGTGTFLIEMAKSGAKCYGIDQSPKMLEILRSKIKRKGIGKNIEKITLGPAEKLP